MSIGLMSLPVENGPSVQVPRALMQAFLKQDPNHPGLETVRLPNPIIGSGNEEPVNLPPYCREVESEVCLVCRRCGRAYPQESSLLTHQRSCYLGNQQRRGALRLVQARFSCSLCDTAASTRTYGSISEWRRHAETVQHRARLESLAQQLNPSQNSFASQFSAPGLELGLGQDPGADEEANPLIDEMEDVVNQITLLAARAAAESTSTGTQSAVVTQDNNNGEAKRQKLVQEVAALAGAR